MLNGNFERVVLFCKRAECVATFLFDTPQQGFNLVAPIKPVFARLGFD